VLSDLIDALRLSARVQGVFELGAPFAVSVPQRPEVNVRLFMLSRGTAFVSVDGRKPIALSAGDLLLMPRPGSLEFRDAVDSRAKPLELSACKRLHLEPVRGGGSGARMSMVGVGLVLAPQPRSKVLESLPSFIHVPANGSAAITTTAALFLQEASQPREGSLALLSRLAEVLFIEVLRREGRKEGCAKGNLRALTDPQLAQALGLMHEAPTKEWTIASLGKAVGLSRSAFAARFSAQVGEAPLEYLARWRMTLAARLLTESDATITEIAGRVGYGSDAAFNKAFARIIGQPPGAFRRTAAA
jgi:AraC-like DNA-binding protein